MKLSILPLLATPVLVATLAVSPAYAGAGHDHEPKYGGVVREAKNIDYELVAKPDSLTLYVSDHGKPVATQGAKTQAVLYAGNGKTLVALEPAGDNRMQAKGNFKVGVGVRAALTVTLAGKGATKVTFKLK